MRKKAAGIFILAAAFSASAGSNSAAAAGPGAREAWTGAKEAAAGAMDPPNIVLILADDLGWKDLGCYGSTYYETPNIDRLAGEGMLFSEAYAAASNCAPSRASLLTGYYTPRHGVFTVGDPARGESSLRKLIPAPNTEILADSFVTLAERLKEENYSTASIGKWHLGQDARQQGFDLNVGGSMQGAPGKDGYFSPYNLKFMSDGPAGEYLTDRLTSEAVKFIAAQKDHPFFLYLPHYAVHTPLEAKKTLEEKYRMKGPSGGQDHAVYAAMIESLDHSVGRIMKALDSLGLAENTIVIFTSDNGGIRSVSVQDPLRAGKGSYYEGGIRVPMIVKWPGKIRAGSTSEIPVMQMDLYPTLLEIAAGPDKTVKEIFPAMNPAPDGISLLPLFRGKNPGGKRPLFWHFPFYLQAYNKQEDDGRDPHFRTRPGSAMRLGKWKLHEYFEDGGLELYDLEKDPGERHNLAEKRPGKAAALAGQLRAWREKVKAPVPTQPNPEYRPEKR